MSGCRDESVDGGVDGRMGWWVDCRLRDGLWMDGGWRGGSVDEWWMEGWVGRWTADRGASVNSNTFPSRLDLIKRTLSLSPPSVSELYLGTHSPVLIALL